MQVLWIVVMAAMVAVFIVASLDNGDDFLD